MKKIFMVSLVKNGLIGGSITAGSEAITYRTGKLTIPSEYRNLEMKYADICEVSTGLLLVLPTVTVKMKDGKEYSFAVLFGRKDLTDILRDKGVKVLGE